MRSRALSALSVAAVVAASGAVVTAEVLAGPAAEAASTATTVTVDAGKDLGAYNNPAWYQNVSGLGPLDLAKVDEIAPKVSRGWRVVHSKYDETTGTVNLNDAGFDQQTQYSGRMLFNLDECPSQFMTLAAPAKCGEILYDVLKHDKQRYPDLQYIELFNETELESTPMTAADYYSWYKIAYGLVNRYNASFDPAIPLRLGGPSAFKLDTGTEKDRVHAFLANYAADTDTAKRLDFISYHEYAHGSNPSGVKAQKSTIAGWLTALGLSGTIPVFVTEYGVFPVGNTAETGTAADHLTQAAAMATLGNYFVQGGLDMPMQWVYLHDDPVKSMFVNGVDGAVNPFYNMVRMEGMLKARRIDAATDSASLTAGGIGVNTTATADGTGIAALTTNYQWTTGTDSHAVTLNVTNLPSIFTGRQILVQRYLVDATTSNYDHDPAHYDLQQVERYVLPAGGTAKPTAFTLAPNAMSLVVLTPVTYAEAESLTPTISAGDNLWNIADTAATGGSLGLFSGNAAGDFVTYPLTAPATGYYHVEARIKRTPTRGVVQPAVDGVPVGAPIDTYLNGYDWIQTDLGVRRLTAGKHTVTFTLTAAGAEGGYAFGVDNFDLRVAYPDRIEAESRMQSSPTGDQVLLLTEAAASAGGYVKAGTNAVGDTTRYTLLVPHAGDFELTAGLKTAATRGICRFTKDGTAIGSPVDLYSASAAYSAKDVGPVHLDGPGLVTIDCTITGKNAAATGYDHAMDYFEFQPIA